MKFDTLDQLIGHFSRPYTPGLNEREGLERDPEPEPEPEPELPQNGTYTYKPAQNIIVFQFTVSYIFWKVLDSKEKELYALRNYAKAVGPEKRKHMRVTFSESKNEESMTCNIRGYIALLSTS